mgnify:CR=1 FL=1
MKKKCPICNSSEHVRIIQWGMPDGEPDPSKYVVGGCIIPDDEPDYICLFCETEFYKGKREPKLKEQPVTYFEESKFKDGYLLKRCETGDFIWLKDEWHRTQTIIDYMFGNNDFVDHISESRARFKYPEAFL